MQKVFVGSITSSHLRKDRGGMKDRPMSGCHPNTGIIEGVHLHITIPVYSSTVIGRRDIKPSHRNKG